MDSIDIGVFIVYLVALIGMGSMFSRMKNAKDMFAAGGKSPWWLSGLSSFMTTFSAGTFVIWGGIAYRYGLVGVSILVMIGISAMFVGYFLAKKWKSYGYDSAAEFLNDRFGKSLVRFYTFLQGIVGLFTMGGAVYALAVVVTALFPLPEGHLLADPATGHFSVTIASLIICFFGDSHCLWWGTVGRFGNRCPAVHHTDGFGIDRGSLDYRKDRGTHGNAQHCSPRFFQLGSW